MSDIKLRSVLISDFNLDIFSGYLNNDEGLPRIEAVAAPFGQVSQLLIKEDSDCWKSHPDFAKYAEHVLNELGYTNDMIHQSKQS